MDIYEHRRARLAVLVERSHKGNVAAFAREHGYSRAQVSQFLSETYNSGRSIGERAARTLEKRCGFPSGWLDEPLTDEELRTWNQPFSTAELRVITDRALPADADPLAGSDTVSRIYIQGSLTPAKDGFVENIEQWLAETTEYLDLYAPSDAAVALQVKGSALLPRVKNAEYLLCDSPLKPTPGDDVIVTFADKRVGIFQFQYSRNAETTFGNINDGSLVIVVPDEQIAFMRVVTAVIHSTVKRTKERT